MGLTLQVLPDFFAVCRLAPDAELPGWAIKGTFRSVSWTKEELSIVCEDLLVPREIRAERGWRAFRIQGPLDFALVGVLLQLAEPLAKAGISIYAISTFDTDYVLVKSDRFSDACEALTKYGHRIREEE
jgi:uncharacterized protein